MNRLLRFFEFEHLPAHLQELLAREAVREAQGACPVRS